jgi:4'-phosphopantetheinyl transferase
MTAITCSWPTPPPKLRLFAAGVHVWCSPLDLPENRLDRFLATLSADERDQAGRFQLDLHRNRFIVCRGTLRTILAGYLGVQAEQLQFQHGAHGKPALAAPWGAEQLHFNVSNSQGLALFALADDRPVGIDVERIRPIENLQRITERYFSPQEQHQWRKLSPDQRLLAFFRCWIHKEALLKATGWGLSFPFNRICVSLSPHEPTRVLSINGDCHEAEKWSLDTAEPASGYAAALASPGNPPKVSYWLWPQ